MNNLNLSKYKLVQPTYIKRKKKKNYKMFDLTIKNNKTFFIKLNDFTKILTHNSDGHHITGLIINFFYKWFPYILEEGRLFRLAVPIVACKYKNTKKYFYSLDEFYKFTQKYSVTDITYLKGLGSLSFEDWQHVMNNKVLFQVLSDKSSNKYMEMAFGDSSNKRKNWLESKSKK